MTRDIVAEAFENLRRFEELNGIKQSKRKLKDKQFIKIGEELISVDSIMHVRKIKIFGNNKYHIEITLYHKKPFNLINPKTDDHIFSKYEADHTIHAILKQLYFQEDS